MSRHFLWKIELSNANYNKVPKVVRLTFIHQDPFTEKKALRWYTIQSIVHKWKTSLINHHRVQGLRKLEKHGYLVRKRNMRQQKRISKANTYWLFLLWYPPRQMLYLENWHVNGNSKGLTKIIKTSHVQLNRICTIPIKSSTDPQQK